MEPGMDRQVSTLVSDDDIRTWHRDGGVVIPSVLSAAEAKAAAADMSLLYDHKVQEEVTGQPLSLKKEGQIGAFSQDQFRNFDDMPFDCSPALNLVALHPNIIALARAALGTDDVHLYQSHSWAKYTGEADFDQTFHCDYKNHTLMVPSDDVSERTINMMIYLTDVTDGHGAIHYVPKPASDALDGLEYEMFPDEDYQNALKKHEVSGASPAGSVFAYGIDVYHRGTNLTVPKGYRYTLTASYKVAGNDMIGWSGWPRSFTKPWHLIFNNATPDQLSCLGVPKPGDPFWTARTLKMTAQRWPDMDLGPYKEAATL